MISGSLTKSLLDHIPQFLIIDKVLTNVKFNMELPRLKKKIKKFSETAFVKMSEK